MKNSFNLDAYLQLDPVHFSVLALQVRCLRFASLYFLMMALLYVFRYSLQTYKIQNRAPSWSQLKREACLSISTFFCFLPSYFLFIVAAQKHYYLLYHPWNFNGIFYFISSIFILIFAHETYHYWYHRFMHTNLWFFRNVHRIHHLSHAPTILSAYAFHPLEAVLHPLIFVLVPLLLPVNIYAIFIAMTIAELFNVLGHMGYEWYPACFARLPLLKYLNRASFHDLHHERSGRKNYSYYTILWDQWMKTHDDAGELHFEQGLKKRKLNTILRISL